tara:strand:+ start:261 stop:407 length:147 start_codon:yes stop_codon:yes gene_type:complete
MKNIMDKEFNVQMFLFALRNSKNLTKKEFIKKANQIKDKYNKLKNKLN